MERMVAGGYPEEDGLCGAATAVDTSQSESTDRAESAETRGGEEAPPAKYE